MSKLYTNKDVLLYIPNLIGYSRVFATVFSFFVMIFIPDQWLLGTSRKVIDWLTDWLIDWLISSIIVHNIMFSGEIYQSINVNQSAIKIQLAQSKLYYHCYWFRMLYSLFSRCSLLLLVLDQLLHATFIPFLPTYLMAWQQEDSINAVTLVVCWTW
jgi:hypothetical protein